jgi:hypothetical protein
MVAPVRLDGARVGARAGTGRPRRAARRRPARRDGGDRRSLPGAVDRDLRDRDDCRGGAVRRRAVPRRCGARGQGRRLPGAGPPPHVRVGVGARRSDRACRCLGDAGVASRCLESAGRPAVVAAVPVHRAGHTGRPFRRCAERPPGVLGGGVFSGLALGDGAGECGGAQPVVRRLQSRRGLRRR